MRSPEPGCSPLIDSAVLDAARAGRGWAFERIYGELAGPVRGYLRQQGVSDPDGITNEAFHRVFRSIGSFDGDPPQLRRWVFTIAHNLVVDQRRFAGRRLDERLVGSIPEVSGGDAELDAIDRLAGDWVRAALAHVSDEQRDVLLLRFILDLSLEEVATMTGRSVTAVKALQRRGLDALRRRVRTGGPPGENEVAPVSRPVDTTFTGLECTTNTAGTATTSTPRSNAS